MVARLVRREATTGRDYTWTRSLVLRSQPQSEAAGSALQLAVPACLINAPVRLCAEAGRSLSHVVPVSLGVHEALQLVGGGHLQLDHPPRPVRIAVH